jgi:hypothetical protein
MDDGHELEVDFKMSNLKPRIGSRFYSTWIKVKIMKNTIIKGWDKKCIIEAFLPAFHLAAMEAN